MQNNNYPKVSICVPVYGVEKYIEKCARSLLEQTYQNIELVFVDDCGPDNSIAILEKTIEKYPSRKACVRIIRHEKNRGLAAARNTAVKNATGDFITHVDSDDWLELNAIELLVNKQLETKADIVSGTIRLHKKDTVEDLVEPTYINKNEMLNEMIKLNLNHTLCKRLIRKSLYTDNNILAIEGFNIGEDHYTLPRLIWYAHSCAKVNNVVYHYNLQTEQSYTQSKERLINIRKYCCDRDSCLFLMNFFHTREVSCVNQLQDILRTYQEMLLNGALRCGDRNAYTIISRDLAQSSFKYNILRPYTILCKIIRKCFGISLGPLNFK